MTKRSERKKEGVVETLAVASPTWFLVWLLCPAAYALISNSVLHLVPPSAVPRLLGLLYLQAVASAMFGFWFCRAFVLPESPSRKLRAALGYMSVILFVLLLVSTYEQAFGQTKARSAWSLGAFMFGGTAGAAWATRLARPSE